MILRLILIFLFTLSSVAYANSVKKQISWPKIKGASKYKIQISPTRNFKKYSEKIAVNPYILFNFKGIGVFYWRIAYFHKEYKKWSPFSIISKISVKDIPLKFLNPNRQNQTLKKSSFKLKWQSSFFHKYFKLIITTPNNKIYQKKLSKKELKLNFKQKGIYTFKLEAYSKKGKKLKTQKTNIIYDPYIFNRQKKKVKKVKKLHSLSSFITTSYGFFSEDFKGVNATTEQNSPYTLGFSYGRILNEEYNLSSSTYISYLVSTGIEGANEKVNIPPEWGLTSYLDLKRYRTYNLTPYIGFDLESFSTFNIDERPLGEKLSTREHRFLYFTVGLSSPLKLFSRNVFLKTSLSQTILSASSRKSLANGANFSGIKGILFLATPINKKWSSHFLLKQHFMSGPTDLSITRYGVGFAYKFF